MIDIRLDGYEDLIRQLDRIDDRLGNRLARECVKAAAEVVAKRAQSLAPVGDSAHNPDAKPLRDTISIELRDYGVRQLAVVGPTYPAGAHGHLVEFGHEEVLWGKRTGRRVGPQPFFRRAFDETRREQESAMAEKGAEAIREVGI